LTSQLSEEIQKVQEEEITGLTQQLLEQQRKSDSVRQSLEVQLRKVSELQNELNDSPNKDSLAAGSLGGPLGLHIPPSPTSALPHTWSNPSIGGIRGAFSRGNSTSTLGGVGGVANTHKQLLEKYLNQGGSSDTPVKPAKPTDANATVDVELAASQRLSQALRAKYKLPKK